MDSSGLYLRTIGKENLLSKQDEIASVLDKVSDLIALRKQQLAKLDELVKAGIEKARKEYILNKIDQVKSEAE